MDEKRRDEQEEVFNYLIVNKLFLLTFKHLKAKKIFIQFNKLLICIGIFRTNITCFFREIERRTKINKRKERKMICLERLLLLISI